MEDITDGAPMAEALANDAYVDDALVEVASTDEASALASIRRQRIARS